MAETKKTEGRLSVNIRRMVDKETEEFTDKAIDVKNTIDGAIKIATGLSDLQELYDSVKDIKVDTTAGRLNISMLDPKGLREILKAGHLEAVREANLDASPATIDRKIGLALSKQKALVAALGAIDGEGVSSLL